MYEHPHCMNKTLMKNNYDSYCYCWPNQDVYLTVSLQIAENSIITQICYILEPVWSIAAFCILPLSITINILCQIMDFLSK